MWKRTSTEEFLEESGIDRKVLGLIIMIFFSLFAILMFFVIYFETRRGECSRKKEEFFHFEYHGKIIRKYRSSNHHYETVVFEDGIEKSVIFNSVDYSKIEPGDELIKNRNELNFILIKKGDTLKFKEVIKDCEQFIEK